jgi:hypothetical protein
VLRWLMLLRVCASFLFAALAAGCSGSTAASTAGPAVRATPATSAVPAMASLAQVVEDGDIVLHRSMSSQSAAVRAATGSAYTHVGLVFHRDGGEFVLGAVQPVRWTPLAAWVSRGEGGAVVVLRLVDGARLASGGADRLKAEAERYLGRAYDGLFAWSDDRIYCSELVFKAYRDALGVEVGHIQPMGSFDLTSPAVRELIHARAAGRVDLNEPVVAPSSLLGDADLRVVFSDDPSIVVAGR